MLSVAHTLASLPFAFLMDQPLLIFCAALLWHVACDTFLHWNIYPHDFKRYPVFWVALDVLGGLAVSYLLLGSTVFTLPVLAAIAGGNIADVLHGLWDFLPPNQRKVLPRSIHSAFVLHDRLQFETHNIRQGLVSQLLLSLISIYVVIG